MVCLTEKLQVHAEVVDQSVKLIRSLKDWDDILNRDKESLDSLATAFADVLTSLRHYIAMMPVTPTTVDENFVPSPRTKKESPGRPCFEIPAEKCLVFQDGLYIGRCLAMVWKT